jgi:hypothetical protein
MARDGRRCRLASFFRIFMIIPIWIVLGTVSGGAWDGRDAISTQQAFHGHEAETDFV